MRALAGAAWIAALFLDSVLFSHTVALRLALLFAGAALVAGTVIRRSPSLRPVPPIWPAFALWGTWAAFSISWSLDAGRSAKEFQNEIVYAALALWVCYVAAQARMAHRVIVRVVALGSTAVCLVAVCAFFFRPSWDWHGGPGTHSSTLITLMPCAAMTAWYAYRSKWSWRAQSLVWLLAALLFLSAYTTLNRTIWIAYLSQITLMGALLALRGRERQPPAALVRQRAAALAIVIAMAVAATAIVRHIQSQREASGSAPEISRDARWNLWPLILERVENRPLTGFGFGRGLLRHPLTQEMNEGNLWHSHNLVLDELVQTGLVGLLLLAGLLAATLREGWRSLRNPDDDLRAACGVALIAVVAGMLIRNMTDVLWVRQSALLYWGIVGVLLAWGAGPKHEVDAS
ncbi:MAG TPA: O-antigen ligase family protein [Burkholderiales bacterium]|nr:O-antigen ligase family protein [Burkholderiales bacterium]